MNSLAIMQPYLFPYMGYFQLIHAVDQFVFYNDVNFIKKGWVHRNRILLNGKEFLFTVPCAGVSQNKRICDTRLAFDGEEKRKLLSTITQAYKRAPFFDEAYSLVEDVLKKEFGFIDELAMESVRKICQYLNINTVLTESKEQYDNRELKKADRLIDICLKRNMNTYVNAMGGQDIYTKEYFRESGVNLQFIKSLPIAYKQFENDFVPWLSVIDVIMFNPKPRAIELLENYELT